MPGEIPELLDIPGAGAAVQSVVDPETKFSKLSVIELLGGELGGVIGIGDS
jgi:hypothetical protein